MTTSISALETDGYFGTDASLEISLFEYGLACIYQGLDNYQFIYKVSEDTFSLTTLSISDILDITNESWFKKSNVESFIGCPIPTSLDDHYEVLNLVSDMVNYYGYENIFGNSYHTFGIDK